MKKKVEHSELPLSYAPPRKNTREDIERLIADAWTDIDTAIRELNPFMVVGLMSGGDDSMPACYVASLHPQFSGILHINTGFGIEETREHVRRTCATRNWKLWEYKATEHINGHGKLEPMIYENFVLEHGFPGAYGHGLMYSRLKERQLRWFQRDMGANGRGKNKKRIMYISGTRITESARRKKNVKKTAIQEITPQSIFVSPIRHWTKRDCFDVREYAGLPRNPVSALIHMSGECLCGAFAHPGELEEIRTWYPDMAKRIDDLEVRVKARGFNWGWEGSPPPKKKKPKGGTHPELQFLCVKCNAR